MLLGVRDHPMTVTELADVLGVSKQATSKLVDVMTTEDIDRLGRHDARRRDVLLTTKGRKLLRQLELIYVELEAEWEAVIGALALAEIRSDLVRVLSQTHDRLPVVRPANEVLVGPGLTALTVAA